MTPRERDDLLGFQKWIHPELGLRPMYPDSQHSGAAGLPFRTRVWPTLQPEGLVQGVPAFPPGPAGPCAGQPSCSGAHSTGIGFPLLSPSQGNSVEESGSSEVPVSFWLYQFLIARARVTKDVWGVRLFGPGLGLILFPSSFPVAPPAPCQYFESHFKLK